MQPVVCGAASHHIGDSRSIGNNQSAMPSFAQANDKQSEVAEVSMENVFAAAKSDVVLNVSAHALATLFGHLAYFFPAIANATSRPSESQGDPAG